jgi:hypothetical protein
LCGLMATARWNSAKASSKVPGLSDAPYTMRIS